MEFSFPRVTSSWDKLIQPKYQGNCRDTEMILSRDYLHLDSSLVENSHLIDTNFVDFL